MVFLDDVVGVEDAGGLGGPTAEWAREADPIRADLARTALLDGLLMRRPTTGRSWRSRARAMLMHSGSSRGSAWCSPSSPGIFGSLFDPRRVVVSGMAPGDAADLVEAARASLALELDLPAPQLVASPLGADVVCIGAVAAALDAARADVLALGRAWRRPRLDIDERAVSPR